MLRRSLPRSSPPRGSACAPRSSSSDAKRGEPRTEGPASAQRGELASPSPGDPLGASLKSPPHAQKQQFKKKKYPVLLGFFFNTLRQEVERPSITHRAHCAPGRFGSITSCQRLPNVLKRTSAALHACVYLSSSVGLSQRGGSARISPLEWGGSMTNMIMCDCWQCMQRVNKTEAVHSDDLKASH